MDLDVTETTMSCANLDTNRNNLASSNGTTSRGIKSTHDIDVIRLIGHHLINLGLKQTVNTLLNEAGLDGLDHPLATKFQQLIMAGEWDKASALVEEMANHSEGDKRSNIKEMKLIIAEQKFFEYMEDNLDKKALKCLRLEITPLTDDIQRIRLMANLIFCKSIEELKSRVDWLGKGELSRQALLTKIQRFLPPLIMLPPKRLGTLLSQAVQYQREHCPLHLRSLDSDSYDLLTDHRCSLDRFPLCSKSNLDNHKTEVWYCKFSNDGTKLATGGLEGKVKIWDLDIKDQTLTERCTLECKDVYSITCLSWSPNDVYLLACGSDDKADLWIWNVNEREGHNMLTQQEDESATSCSWHLSGEKFAAASTKGNFKIYDLNGECIGRREGVRVQCLSFLNKDPSVILAADSLNRIKSYEISLTMSYEIDILEEHHPILSFTVDRDDRFIAVNLMSQGVHLWDYKSKTMVRTFTGVSQRNFTVYSSFSSPDSTFLASGSEDGNIYIYHVDREQPVAVLHGHSRCVNCVSWNPQYSELFASVSDDRVVRLWTPISKDDQQDRLQMNGKY